AAAGLENRRRGVPGRSRRRWRPQLDRCSPFARSPPGAPPVRAVFLAAEDRGGRDRRVVPASPAVSRPPRPGRAQRAPPHQRHGAELRVPEDGPVQRTSCRGRRRQ
ncbi:unnamed protein product, partial [Scytosiphon promiscuus]